MNHALFCSPGDFGRGGWGWGQAAVCLQFTVWPNSTLNLDVSIGTAIAGLLFEIQPTWKFGWALAYYSLPCSSASCTGNS